MKKIVTLMLLFLVVFSACSLSPFAERKTPVKSQKIYSVYVCGAVEKEGFVDAPEGSDFGYLLDMAGASSHAFYPVFSLELVTENTKILAVDYYDGEKACPCINVNGGAVTSRMTVENIDISVINILADHIEQHGKIRNKSVLKAVLGDELYRENYYKFFVDISDYEYAGV